MYQDDPLGELGYIHDALFRAVRLVVDSGLHAKRWSREKAIAYYVETLGDKEATATTEVERYCVEPGQACGYMLGKLRLLALRQQAKAKLGDRFDIRAFHDAGLTCGAVPLDVLPRLIDRYVPRARAGSESESPVPGASNPDVGWSSRHGVEPLRPRPVVADSGLGAGLWPAERTCAGRIGV